MLKNGNDHQKSLFLQVFDKAEFLRDMEPNILPTFLKLQELVGSTF
jgi:hypothetical protein